MGSSSRGAERRRWRPPWFSGSRCTLGLEALGSFGALSLGPMLAWGVMVGAIGGVFGGSGPEWIDDPSPLRTGEPLSLGCCALAGAPVVGRTGVGDAVAAPGREGGQRRADLSSLFRGAMVEGRPAVPGGQLRSERMRRPISPPTAISGLPG